MARLLETEWILIEAPADVVWSTLTDFASHQTWDTYVVAWEGEAKVGSRMRLVAMADRRREFIPIVTESSSTMIPPTAKNSPTLGLSPQPLSGFPRARMGRLSRQDLLEGFPRLSLPA